MTSIRLRHYAALLAASLLTAATAASAHAATYTVAYCDATNPSTAGWAPSVAGSSWTYYADECANGGSMSAYFDSAQAHAAGTQAQWTLTAPVNTTFASLSAERSWAANSSQPYGDSHAFLATDKGWIDSCTKYLGCTGLTNTATWDLQDTSTLRFGVQCTGSGCPAAEVYSRFRRLSVSIKDDFAPVLSDIGGPLTSPSAGSRYRSLSYNATDKGGGIYRRRLVLNGIPSGPELIDPNNGDCKQPAAKRVPCKLSVADQLTFDTTRLSDGPNTVALLVSDITDANAATSPTWQITVDNQPPTMGAPVVTGGSEPRVGTPLTCHPYNLDGQSPSIAYQWYRANPDGSGQAGINGATAATYTPVDADVAKKLRCGVTATDGGGSSTAMSSITDGPFADGQTVKAHCDGQPTAPTDPCGDFDGDGQPNYLDTDDDGDAIADEIDAQPLHADASSSSSSRSDTQTVVLVGADDGMPVLSDRDGLAGAPSNGTGAANRATLILYSSRTHTLAWGRRLRITGRLVNANGQPISRAVITIQQRAIVPKHDGYAPGSTVQTAASATTDARGNFTWTAPAAMSRELLFTYKANLANTTIQALSTMRLNVRSKVTLRPARTRLHNGQTLHLTGRVASRPLPAAGVVVNLQAYVPGRGWVVFASPRTDGRGRFKASYRFRYTTATTRYRLRAVSRMDSAALFLPTTSRRVDVIVATE